MGKKQTMLEALSQYGDRSVDGLERMAHALQGKIDSAPPEVDDMARTLAGVMPGAGLLTSADIARESGRLWRDGRYGRSIGRMSDSILPAFTEMMWLMPGAGVVGRIAK